uniref:(California timema) hypothetical protein n=1 Tax=Timema californicum TaxID=61474 RepID=A0A7R9JG67_TIMCA|nr:unnamed protein product [Timema californicum]
MSKVEFRRSVPPFAWRERESEKPFRKTTLTTNTFKSLNIFIMPTLHEYILNSINSSEASKKNIFFNRILVSYYNNLSYICLI